MRFSCLFLAGFVTALVLVPGPGSAQYQPYPWAWKLPFYNSMRIETGYSGTVCGGGYNSAHTGRDQFAIDWNTPGWGDNGNPIPAPASGWVVYAGPNGGYGNTVIVDAGGGYIYLIAHMQQYIQYCGWVNQGQWLGTVGTTGKSSGPHIHFAVYYPASYAGSGKINASTVRQNGISGHWNLYVCSYYSSG